MLIDLNYSSSNSQGTGTEILVLESTTGVNILCDDSNFASSPNCSYSWVADSVPDGNYYILVFAHDGVRGGFGVSASDFNIYTSAVPPVVGVDNNYSTRYLSPFDSQRDSNVYLNVAEFNALTDEEKQTSYLKSIETYIFFGGIIILLIVGFIGWKTWKRKR